MLRAGDAAFGTTTFLDFQVGTGVTFNADANATLSVGANSVGLLIAYDNAQLATPQILSNANGADPTERTVHPRRCAATSAFQRSGPRTTGPGR